MSHEQLSASMIDREVGQGPASTFMTDRHRGAVEALSRAFSSSRPLTVMIGEGRLASGFVIRTFLEGLSREVAVARIDEPCASATEFMGKVIDAVGFQPNDMSLEDLEGIFMMFLSFQKSHGRRTVLCIERAQDNDLWVLDKIRSLVQREDECYSGLMLVVAGDPGLKELLQSGPLSAVSAIAGKGIVLPRFTMVESKEYIRHRLISAGKAGIDRLFHYQAITGIHELSRGIPDKVAELMDSCLEAAAAEGVSLVTAELVQRADESRASTRVAGDRNAETVNMQGFRPRAGRLVFQITGEEVREMTLRQGHTLIGRSTLCDVRIDTSTVSRRHALISYTPDRAILVDLNSTNGTFVDGNHVKRHELQPGETIEVGGTRIEYVTEADTLQDDADGLETGEPLISRS